MRKLFFIVCLLAGLLSEVTQVHAQSTRKKTTYELYAEEAAKTPAEEWVKRGDDQYERQNVVGAVACYGWAADQGHADAQFKYGYALYFGEGIENDYTSAAMWFKRAAVQGHAKAMYNLAYCYMYGKGVPTNYEKALEYLKQSAQNGCKEAQETLAECYEKGVLVEQDADESLKWKRMANGGEPVKQPEQPAATEADQAVQWPEQPETVMPELLEQPSMTVDLAEQQPAKPQTADNSSSQPLPQQGTTAETTANNNPSSSGQGTILSREDILKMKDKPAPTQGKPVAQTPEQSVVAAPPALRILFPVDQASFHTRSIKVKYQLIAKGMEDKTHVTVMVDGVKQPTDRAVKAANTIDVDLPDHDCTVILYAQNEYGNSEPASIRLVREQKQETLPRLLAVAIGVGDYHDPQLPPLKFTSKDAKDFSTSIMKKKHFPYSEVQVKLLCDSMATRDEFFESMEWLKQEATPNDVCIFFYAGHGYRDEKDRFYFMPFGSTTDRLYNCFSSADFRREAEDINSKFIVFVDACYSGALMEGNRSASAHFVEQLRRTKNGMVLFASSASDTKSKEDTAWGNGAFTKVLVDAMNGAAREPGDEGLSTQQLEQYLYKEVRKLTDFKQTPIFINPSGIEHFNIFTYEP